MSEWRTVKLNDVGTISRGVSYNGAGLNQPGPLLVGMGQVQPDGGLDLSDARTYGGKVKSEHFLREEDVAIVMTDLTQNGQLLGSPARAPLTLVGELVISHHLQRLHCGPSLDPRFAHYLLMGPEWKSHVRGMATGTTVRAVGPDDAARFGFSLPQLDEQRAIAGVLGALDDKIESNRRASALLERILEAEYALATEGAPDAPCESALDVQMGSPFSGDAFCEPGVGRPLIRIRDLKTFSPQVWTTEQRADEIVINRGDVLVGMDAEFRSTLWLGDQGVLNQRMCRFVPRTPVGTAFVWFAIKPDLEFCERAKSGTTVIHLNKSDIERFRVPHLSVEEHQQFRSVSQPMIERLASLGLESSLLASLRDALLPELLSGRLRVRDAENHLEGAV